MVAAGRGETSRGGSSKRRTTSAIPVLRDVPLARALIELEIGDEIPEALYEAVAEILRAAWDGRS